jgi:hexosaminidase
MRTRLLLALTALSLGLTATARGQTSLQLRWELAADSMAAFTLTNRGTKPLPPSGWAIYYNALHSAQPGSLGGGFISEDLTGDLHRLVPATGFAGLSPGASVRIPYVTDVLLNRSFAPQGPYIVFDNAKDVGVPLDYVAAPFEHPSVSLAERQFALDSQIRAIPASDLPPVFPTPVQVTKGTGTLRLSAMPKIQAADSLKNEAAFAADYLRPYFGTSARGTAPSLRLEVGAVEGQSSAEAYSLAVDAQGIRIVGASPAGVFYGLQSLRTLLPAPSPRAGIALPAISVVDAPRFGYRGFMLDVARNFHQKSLVLSTIDLLARYKLNVLHLHLTDDEGWRVEIPSIPELTAIGARRGHPPESARQLQPAFGSGPLVDRPWGSGFFSHADYVEIVRYAAARHIEVIPELEMPGHARAAIKSMKANQQYRLDEPEDRSVYTSVRAIPTT